MKYSQSEFTNPPFSKTLERCLDLEIASPEREVASLVVHTLRRDMSSPKGFLDVLKAHTLISVFISSEQHKSTFSMSSNATMSSTRSNRVLAVFGTGPGNGNAVTSLFVTKRYSKVALLARGKENLKARKESLEAVARSNGINIDIKTWAVDLADVKALTPILSEIDSFGELECVFYNGARVRAGPFFDETVEDLRYDFEVSIRILFEYFKYQHILDHKHRPLCGRPLGSPKVAISSVSCTGRDPINSRYQQSSL